MNKGIESLPMAPVASYEIHVFEATGEHIQTFKFESKDQAVNRLNDYLANFDMDDRKIVFVANPT